LIYILPDLDEDFAAEVGFDGLLAGHQTLRSRDEDEATAGLNLGDFGAGDVDTTARFGDLGDFVNRRGFASFREGNVEGVARRVVKNLIIEEITSLLETVNNGNFELRRWDVDLVLPYQDVVADAG